jgi:hypothetical protein
MISGESATASDANFRKPKGAALKNPRFDLLWRMNWKFLPISSAIDGQLIGACRRLVECCSSIRASSSSASKGFWTTSTFGTFCASM